MNRNLKYTVASFKTKKISRPGDIIHSSKKKRRSLALNHVKYCVDSQKSGFSHDYTSI